VTERTVRFAARSDDVVVMLRRLSLPEHGAVELVVGLGLIAAPLVLGFGPAGLLASMTAGAIVVGLGLSEGLPISAHMTSDFVVAIGLLAVAVAVAGGGERVAGGLLAAAAATELALSLGTRWTRRSH
jgi:hypothetical protein